MKPSRISIALLVVSLVFSSALFAQAPASESQSMAGPAPAASAAEVPRLIKFSGSLLDEEGLALAGPVGVTFALYARQTDGAALWIETQNVKPDRKGNYTVLLGANSAHGLPAELFTSAEARWLGMQVEHQPEQPRVLLVSVPYALKASDADTLGGLPPSAFAQARSSLAEPSSAVSSSSSLLPLVAASPAPSNNSTDPNVTTPGGTVNFVPKFDTPSDVKTSQIFDNGTNVGIGFPVTPTPVPVAKLDINGSANVRGTLQLPATGTATSTSKGFNSSPFDFLASVFNGTAAVNQHFRWQAEPVNPGISTASGKLNLLFASGAGTLAETGLSINNKGLITFASGQTFPTVTGNETVSGNVSAKQFVSTVATGSAPFTVSSKTLVLNLNASLLGGLSASAFPTLGAATNSFSGSQLIAGSVGIGTTSPATRLDVFSTSDVNGPIGRFGSSGVNDSNSLKIYNGSGITETFQAGCISCFVPGTQVGDGGMRVSPGKNMVLGDSGAARLMLDSAGNASQPLIAGGMVKAMLLVYVQSGGIITACFNSTLSGAAATSPPCGFSVSRIATGNWNISFPFIVRNHVLSATPFGITVIGAYATDNNTVFVRMFSPDGLYFDDDFYLIVY